MINLNLLPQKEKVNLEWDLWRRLILFLFLAVFAGSVIFFSVLVGTNLYLLKNLEKSAAALSLRRQLPLGLEIQIIEERLAEADKKLKQISKIRGMISAKSFILPEIASMVPRDCRLLSLSVKNDSSAELVGFAENRAALLAFKKSLENNQNISGLNFPLANLLKERDIEFVLSFKFKAK